MSGTSGWLCPFRHLYPFPFETHPAETTDVGQASDRLLVLVEREDESAFQLHAFDVATGDRIWTTDTIPRRGDWRPYVEMVGDIAYVGAERLRALDVKTGDERWSAAVDGGPIRAVTVVDEGVEADQSTPATLGSRGSPLTASGRENGPSTSRSRATSSVRTCT